MRSWIYLLAAALAFTSLSGCGRNNESNAENDKQHIQSTSQKTGQQINSTPAAPNTNEAASVPADVHLEQLAARVPGVKSAHAVMMGKTAIVGIDVDSKLDRSRVGTIKYSVAEAIHKDPRGANAVVTADADLTQRLAEMGTSIREGRPIEGMANELADIVGRIVPQMPSDVQTNEDNQQISPSAAPVQEKNAPGGRRIETPPNRSNQPINREHMVR